MSISPTIIMNFPHAEEETSTTTIGLSQTMFFGALLILFQAADGVLTTLGMSRYGTELEGNPVLRFLMDHFGHIPVLAAVKIVAISVVVFLVSLSQKLPWVKGALGALTFIYFFLAIVPWTYVLFFA